MTKTSIMWTDALVKWHYLQTISSPLGITHEVYTAKVGLHSQYLENNDCENLESGTALDFNMGISLVTYTNFKYVRYPIEILGELGGPLSCDIFDETCVLCESQELSCSSAGEILEPEYTLAVCIDCNECNDRIEIKNRNIVRFDQEFSLGPNPFTSTIKLEFDHRLEEEVFISVISIDGGYLLRKTFITEAGSNIYMLNTANLNAGIYYLKFRSSSKEIVKKIVKIE